MGLSFQINEDRFLALLTTLVAETPRLQNDPPRLIPEEDFAVRHVLASLNPYSTRMGGPLEVTSVGTMPGRSNLLVRYPGTSDRSIGLVGMHFDVVPADPRTWSFDPFRLSIDGDRLRGRGTTDCLGHVALITDFLIHLAETRPPLRSSITAVFIANEEAGAPIGIGIDYLLQRGLLEPLRRGPVFWLDSYDIHPNIATGGLLLWRLILRGKGFHSGMPHRGINALELAMAVVPWLQDKFYGAFPRLPEEALYHFETGSTLKPTRLRLRENSRTQIPGECLVEGDIRLTPFYRAQEVKTRVEEWIRDLNPADLPTRGPSMFALPGGTRGAATLEWIGEATEGIACRLDTPAYSALCQAVREEIGLVRPYSDTGSLPLVRQLQDAGFDIQLTGFGRGEAYHSNNEYALLSDFRHGARILARLVDLLEEAEG